MNFLLAEGDDEPKAKEELVAEYKKLDEALGKVRSGFRVECSTAFTTK